MPNTPKRNFAISPTVNSITRAERRESDTIYSFQDNKYRSLNAFENLVIPKLKEHLDCTIAHVEAESENPNSIARTLDQEFGIDFRIVPRKNSGRKPSFASSRIFFKSESELAYPPTITIGATQSFFECNSELDRLTRLLDNRCNNEGDPFPKHYTFARVTPKDTPARIHDLMIIETEPLIRHILENDGFDIDHEHVMNDLRQEFRNDPNSAISFDCHSGIRSNCSREFIFMSKEYLLAHGLLKPENYLLFSNISSGTKLI